MTPTKAREELLPRPEGSWRIYRDLTRGYLKIFSTGAAGLIVRPLPATGRTSTQPSSRSYYQVLVDGDNIYISDTVTTGVAGTGNTNFSFSNNESRTALKQATDGYTGGGWYAVPEPTSGLLMLLGMAGLALRRRRA